MSSLIFTYPFVVRENYLDVFGHMNNATYLVLYEEARWEIITKNGYGLKKIMDTGQGPVLLDVKISFLKELKVRDEINIVSQMISYERKIGKISQKMIRNNDICSTAEYTIGLFDLKERKLILPTPEWLQALGIKNETQ